MNFSLRGYRRNFLPERSALFIVLALISLPYLTDVAFLGDFTPTHFAQENVTESEHVEAQDGQAFTVIVDDHEKTLSPTWRGFPRDHVASVPIFPFQCLLTTSSSSRPPPHSYRSPL